MFITCLQTFINCLKRSDCVQIAYRCSDIMKEIETACGKILIFHSNDIAFELIATIRCRQSKCPSEGDIEQNIGVEVINKFETSEEGE